jgi:hypothetical protein
VWRFRNVVFVGDRRGAWFASVTHPSARTRQGVAVGDRLDEVKRAYSGLRCGEANRGGDYIQFPYCTGQVASRRFIWFGGDPIESITLSIAPLR